MKEKPAPTGMTEKLNLLWQHDPLVALAEAVATVSDFWAVLIDKVRRSSQPESEKRRIVYLWRLAVHQIVDSAMQAVEVVESLPEPGGGKRKQQEGRKKRG